MFSPLETCWDCRVWFGAGLRVEGQSFDSSAEEFFLSSFIQIIQCDVVSLDMLLFALGFFLMGRVAFLCPVISSTVLEGFAALHNKFMFPLLSSVCFPVFICDSKPCWNGSLRHLFLSLCQNKLFCRADIIFFHDSLLPFFCIYAVRYARLITVFCKRSGVCLLCRLYVVCFSNLPDPISCWAKPPCGWELQDTFHRPHRWRERLLLWEYFPNAIQRAGPKAPLWDGSELRMQLVPETTWQYHLQASSDLRLCTAGIWVLLQTCCQTRDLIWTGLPPTYKGAAVSLFLVWVAAFKLQAKRLKKEKKKKKKGCSSNIEH